MKIERLESEPKGAELHLVTYLAPGLPMALFEAVAARIASVLGATTCLASEATRSAPEPDGPDPFSTGLADVGFLCAPGYLWLAARRPPAVELVPAAFVFDDPRCQGRPVYFAELIVARSSGVSSLAELRGARWVYNDPCSLSGYFSVLAAVDELANGCDFFRSVRAVGSHHAALSAVERGEASTCRAKPRKRQAAALLASASRGDFPLGPPGSSPALILVPLPSSLLRSNRKRKRWDEKAIPRPGAAGC